MDGFFEWKAINGQKARQPYAIAMKDGSPFGIAGLRGQIDCPPAHSFDRIRHTSHLVSVIRAIIHPNKTLTFQFAASGSQLDVEIDVGAEVLRNRALNC